MPIFVGNNEIGNILFQSNEIGEVYCGSNLVFSNIKTISLGKNKTFDVKTIYPQYKDLTADNFFIKTADGCTAGIGVRMRDTDTEREWSAYTVSCYKSYDKSTGTLTAYLANTGKSSSVEVYLVTKPSKLIHIGKGTSFDITSIYSKYASLTANNFVFLSADSYSRGSYFYPQGYTYDDYGSGTFSIVKSYNSSTGQLAFYTKLTSTDTSGVYNWYSQSYYQGTGAVDVYLIEKL